MCSTKSVSASELLNLSDLNLKNCKVVEILGITIDRNLNCKRHIKNICRKAGQKLSALLRISSHINTDKKVLLYKSMIKFQFAYCPLVWKFGSPLVSWESFKTHLPRQLQFWSFTRKTSRLFNSSKELASFNDLNL